MGWTNFHKKELADGRNMIGAGACPRLNKNERRRRQMQDKLFSIIVNGGVENDPYHGVEDDPYHGVENDPYHS
jgi:hypothetical protein